MGPRDEPRHEANLKLNEAEPDVEAADEEQATAGGPQEPELVALQVATLSSQASSLPNSDSSVFSRSISSGRESFISSRKTPIHRRFARIFGRSSDSSSVPLIKRRYETRMTQNIRSLDGYPQGYGKIAAIEACDPNFLIYRKFAWLHNRVLLHYQDELVQLEKQLEQLDHYQFRESPERLISRRRDDVSSGEKSMPKRKDLLRRIDTKLAEYHSLLLRMQEIQAIKRSTERNQSSLHNLINGTGSLASQEAEWIHMGPDLAALGNGQEYGKFNTIQKGIYLANRPNNTSGRHHVKDFKGAYQELLSPTRFDVLLRIVLTILAAALLLIPVLILFKNQPTSPAQIQEKATTQILTVLFFTLAFSASCSIFTKARRQEVFTATAAYCAVLVVFRGNTSNVNTAAG